MSRHLWKIAEKYHLLKFWREKWGDVNLFCRRRLCTEGQSGHELFGPLLEVSFDREERERAEPCYLQLFK